MEGTDDKILGKPVNILTKSGTMKEIWEEWGESGNNLLRYNILFQDIPVTADNKYRMQEVTRYFRLSVLGTTTAKIGGRDNCQLIS